MSALVIEDFVAERALVEDFEDHLGQTWHLKIAESISDESEQRLWLHEVIINFLVDMSIKQP